MKVIDILNKIANGEELPQQIKFHNMIWNKESELDYCEDYYSHNINVYLFYNKWALTNNLNDEVEIIEEEKKIPEKITMRAGLVGDINNKIENLDINIMAVEDTLNQVIDYLKNKGE